MAKRVQRARLVVPEGVDLNTHVTNVSIPLDGAGLSEVTLTVLGVRLDTDPETGLITITLGG